jgi:linoleoyl-CoA desaturase
MQGNESHQSAVLEKEAAKKLKFGKNSGFKTELRRRVDELFQNPDRKYRDCPQMYAKTIILLLSFFGLYSLLVLVAHAWWQVASLCIMLGVVTAGIGFGIQHDGAHHSYSDSLWVNKLMAMSLDLIGGSSYIWHWKHNVLHHTYTNISGYDMDLDVGILGRLSPSHPHLAFHRWQHYYLWLLYGLLAIKWHFYDDFYCLIAGKIGDRRYPRPKFRHLVKFFGGKLIFFALAFAIPLQFHSLSQVLASYGLVAVTLGVVLSVVFQLAHVVEEADFPLPIAEVSLIEKDWAVHQIETTINFSRNNHLMTWLLGGLNFQVEHHLFPNICHINYPELSKVVEQTCREYGVRYNQHSSFWSGLSSHYRWLRKMGTSS